MRKFKKISAKAARDKQITCLDTFQVKKVGGDVYVEGWANKAVVDRGKDIIKTDAWNLENYQKVPMILFNHDKDKPIGKAVDVRATDAGLWIKAKLSRSKDAEISRIRDLVEEGILNAFSVGFDSQDEEKDEGGINNIKQAELYEVSIVTLPMNQDSIFSVSAKTLASLPKEEAVRKILHQKGAWVAEAVHGRMYEEEKGGKKRDEILQAIAASASIDMEQLTQVLAGNVTPVPEAVLAAFSEVLGLDQEELSKLDAGDVEAAGASSEEPQGEQPPPEENQEEPPPEEEGKEMPQEGEEEEKPGYKGLEVGVIGVLIPKEQAESAEAAAQMAQQAGYSAENVQETENGYLILQDDPNMFIEGQTSQIDLGNGIMAIIGVKKPAEEDGGEDDVSPESGSTSEEPPAEEEGKTATVNTKDVEGTPIPGSGDGTITAEGNPQLEQARQTNILLGVLIQEMRGISSKLDNVAVQKVEDVHQEAVDQEEEPKPEDEEMNKILVENLRNYLSDLETKLKKLGA